jgi:hypothetical protein
MRRGSMMTPVAFDENPHAVDRRLGTPGDDSRTFPLIQLLGEAPSAFVLLRLRGRARNAGPEASEVTLMIDNEGRQSHGEYSSDCKRDQPRNDAGDGVAFVVCVTSIRAADADRAEYRRHYSEQSCERKEDDQHRQHQCNYPDYESRGACSVSPNAGGRWRFNGRFTSRHTAILQPRIHVVNSGVSARAPETSLSLLRRLGTGEFSSACLGPLRPEWIKRLSGSRCTFMLIPSNLNSSLCRHERPYISATGSTGHPTPYLG